jgi:hypothetical protein
VFSIDLDALGVHVQNGWGMLPIHVGALERDGDIMNGECSHYHQDVL